MSNEVISFAELSISYMTSMVRDLIHGTYKNRLTPDQYMRYLEKMKDAGECLVIEANKKLTELAKGDAIGATL